MLRSPFLSPEQADESGLVAVGGDLSTERVLLAYCSGVFPWFSDGEPICWWSPNPRAIFELGDLHIPRRLARSMRAKPYGISFNLRFGDVIRECAFGRAEGTWITQGMIEAYERLHRHGYAHSIEVWDGEDLAGGLYGVAIGGFFAGESMFSRSPDASKIALVHLERHLINRGFELFDTQMLTEHTARMGAVEIPRADYLRRLAVALKKTTTFLD